MEEIKQNGKKASMKAQVGELYDLMKTEDLVELEVKEGDFYVYLKRKGAETAHATQMMMPQQVMMAPQQVAVQVPQETVAPAATAKETPKGETVQSPIIGTYYQAASPTSPVFVKEGDVVDSGRTLCIIEAMKVMNEIKAEHKMKIVKVLVENGKPVTAGQDLFVIEKA